jgi:hypothetical protein
VGPSESVSRLLTTDFRPDIGNWYHFIKIIHRIKNVKQLLQVVSYFVVIIYLSGLCKPLFWRMLSIGQDGGTGNEFMEPRGAGGSRKEPINMLSWNLLYWSGISNLMKLNCRMEIEVHKEGVRCDSKLLSGFPFIGQGNLYMSFILYCHV